MLFGTVGLEPGELSAARTGDSPAEAPNAQQPSHVAQAWIVLKTVSSSKAPVTASQP